MTRPDIAYEDHGTIVVFKPLSPAGLAWWDENVDDSGMPLSSRGWRPVDHRPAADIATGILHAGLTLVSYRTTLNQDN